MLKKPTGKTALAERLQSLTEEANLTQQSLANTLHVSRGAVQGYLSGATEPPLFILQSIAEYFSVSIDWLIGRPGSQRTLNTDLQAVCAFTGLSEDAAASLHVSKSELENAIRQAEAAYADDTRETESSLMENVEHNENRLLFISNLICYSDLAEIIKNYSRLRVADSLMRGSEMDSDLKAASEAEYLGWQAKNNILFSTFYNQLMDNSDESAQYYTRLLLKMKFVYENETKKSMRKKNGTGKH